MKRIAAGLAIAAACVAATAGAAGAAGPKQDLVSGSGKGLIVTNLGTFSGHVHVRAKGDATVARGQTWSRFFDTPVGLVATRGSALCVNADGNEAIVMTVTRRANQFVPVGSVFLWKIVDNGQGSNDPPDEIGVTPAPFPPPTSCPPPALAPIPTGPVGQGNLVVKDRG